MSVTDDLLKNNERYAADFDKGDVSLPPARGVAVVACMDARLHVSAILGLEIGDAHIIRNAGGVITDDAIRSLVISQRLLGTREIVLIHHTDCGMLTFDNASLRGKVREELGPQAGTAAADIDFLSFSDVEQSVRDDVAELRASPLIPRQVPVRGFVYDVRSGRVTEVDAAPRH